MSLLYNIIELTACILTFLYCIHTVAIFLSKSPHFTWWKLLCACTLYTAFTWQPIPFLSNDSVSFLALLFCFGIAMVLFQGHWWIKLLIIVTFNIFDLIITILILSLFHFLTGIPIEQLAISGSVERVLLLIFFYLFEFCILFFVSRIKIHYSTGEIQGLGITVLFFICDFSVTFLVYYILRYYSKGHSLLTTVCIFLDIFVILLSFIGLHMLKSIYTHHLNEIENQVLQQHLNDQKRLLKESEEKYEMVRSIKHDMKKYLINYRFLLQEGNVKEVLDNISAQLDGPLDSTMLTFTDNQMLNALLHREATRCREQDILFKTNIHIHPLYRDIEFMIVITNLLENAIEAETLYPVADRLIRLEVIEEDEKISLIVQNYIKESILEKNPNLNSTKLSLDDHGIGLKNIKRIVASHNGLIDIYETDCMFNVHILLPVIHKYTTTQ